MQASYSRFPEDRELTLRAMGSNSFDERRQLLPTIVNVDGVLSLTGDFDIGNRAEVRKIFEVVATPVQIDMEQTTFIDASILGELARLAKRLSPHRPMLISARPHVRRILDLVEFNRIFDY